MTKMVSLRLSPAEHEHCQRQGETSEYIRGLIRAAMDAALMAEIQGVIQSRRYSTPPARGERSREAVPNA